MGKLPENHPSQKKSNPQIIFWLRPCYYQYTTTITTISTTMSSFLILQLLAELTPLLYDYYQ